MIGTRGNGPLETILTFPVLFGTFLTIVELGELELASLTTSHSAVETARVASVVLADDPAFYDVPVGVPRGRRLSEIVEAAHVPLRAAAKDARIEVTFPDRTVFRPGDKVKVRVKVDLQCRVPFGKYLLCGPNARRTFVREAELPYQGASYAYP